MTYETQSQPQPQPQMRWYFGGVSSLLGSVIAHPLDLLKVHLQTQQSSKKSMLQLRKSIVQQHGVLSLYNGYTASAFRQLTYGTTRFGIYEAGKQYIDSDHTMSRFALALAAGVCGGIVGVPADKINVRMQNDLKLPVHERYNYKHVLHGLLLVYREEGFQNLYSGGSMAVCRAAMLTVGQSFTYDQTKLFLITDLRLEDKLNTHIMASIVTAAVCTLITLPVDVLKTRLMSAEPGTYRSIAHLVRYTSQQGALAFFKGFVPAFLRMGPLTVFLFLSMEQMRKHFGYMPT